MPQSNHTSPDAKAATAECTGFAPLSWLGVMLAAAFFLPAMMSAFFLPKVAWAAFALAAGYCLAAPRPPRPWRPSLLGVAWGAYLLWALASAVWAPSPRVVLDRWLVLALATAAYPLAMRSRFWQSDRFWAPFWGLIVLLCTIGFVQNLPSAESPGSWAWRLGGWIPSRGHPSITMGYRNQAAMFLAIVLPFAFWRAFASSRRTVRALSILAALLMLVFIIVVRTRAAWLGLCGGMGFVFLLGLWRRLRQMPGRSFGVAALLLLALLVVPLSPGSGGAGGLMAKSVPRLKRSLTRALMSIPRGGDEGRLEMWRLAIAHFRPLGVGLGCLPMDIGPDRAKVVQLNWEIHNDYLQNLADLGIPGFLAFVAVFVALLRLAWLRRNRGAALAAGMAVCTLAIMLVFTFLSRRIDSLLWMVGVAAILSGIGDDSKRAGGWTPPRGLVRTGDFALAAALAFYGAMAARAAWADHALFRNVEKPQVPLQTLADDVLPRLDVDTTIAHIQAHQYALLALRAKQPAAAAEFARGGLAVYPVDRGLYQIMAMAAYAQGHMTDAVRLQERAVELMGDAPSVPGLERLGLFYRRTGQVGKAEQAAIRARQIATPQLQNDGVARP